MLVGFVADSGTLAGLDAGFFGPVVDSGPLGDGLDPGSAVFVDDAGGSTSGFPADVSDVVGFLVGLASPELPLGPPFGVFLRDARV